MKITLNKDKQIVDVIKEGLEHTGGYCLPYGAHGGNKMYVPGI